MYPYYSDDEESLLRNWIANKDIDSELERIIVERKVFNSLDYIYSFFNAYEEIESIVLKYPRVSIGNIYSYIIFDFDLVINPKILEKNNYRNCKKFFLKYMVDNVVSVKYESGERSSDKIDMDKKLSLKDCNPYIERIYMNCLFKLNQTTFSWFYREFFKNKISLKLTTKRNKNSDNKVILTKDYIEKLIYKNLGDKKEIFDKFELMKKIKQAKKEKEIKI